MSQPVVITKMKFKKGGIVAYPSFELFNSCRGKSERSQENLKDNRVKGVLSRSSAKRMTELIYCWTKTLEAKLGRNSRRLHNHLGFVTLTMSARQEHDDKTIKRELFNKFMIYAKRKWGLKNFIWKAESQDNGNIHFHILVDVFIPHEELREVWNGIQEGLGYITRFQEKWGHRNPNSTDIHSLYKDRDGKAIGDIAAYLAKYMSKKECLKRGIEGRIWGCSDSVKLFKEFTAEEDNEICEFVDFCIKKGGEVYHGEYFSILKWDWEYELRTFFPKLHKKYIDHYAKFIEFLQ